MENIDDIAGDNGVPTGSGSGPVVLDADQNPSDHDALLVEGDGGVRRFLVGAGAGVDGLDGEHRFDSNSRRVLLPVVHVELGV